VGLGSDEGKRKLDNLLSDHLFLLLSNFHTPFTNTNLLEARLNRISRAGRK